MQLKRHLSACLAAAALAVLAMAMGCTSSSSSGDAPASPATGTVAMSLSDASTEDWAVIGVKVLSITLTPQGGGTPQTILAAPASAADAPMVNLVQLDNLSEVLGNAQVPVGTYTQATLTISANPGDVLLTVANSPSASFLADTNTTAGATIPSSDITIKGVAGVSPDLITSVPITLATPLVVTAGQSANLNVEFVLSHPAFIVDHEPLVGDTLWTVNFSDTVKHKPVSDTTQLVIRHLYGQISQVAADGSSITITRDLPTLPSATPELPVPTLQILKIAPDAANGTWFTDLDTQTKTRITSFSSALTAGQYIRAAVRYQNGALVAARMWESATFNSVWLSPEGHVTQVTTASPYQIYIESENGGAPVPVTITDLTQFYFRTPANPAADAVPLATGIAFMTTGTNLVRGFKVHISPVDPGASPLVADSVDIETAGYTGYLSNASATGFTDTRAFANAADNYTATLGYISSSTANGTDTSGNPVLGYQWWNLTQPALADTDLASAFYTTVGGNVDFGGSVGPIKVWGRSVAIPVLPFSNAWDARFTVLDPVRLPKGTVTTPFAADASGGTFSMTVKGGNTTPVVVNLGTTGTLVYQIDVNGGVYTLTPISIATAASMLGASAPVVVFAVPQPGGTVMADVLYVTSTSAL
jgi:hypothetical protein